jgi:hypothetical protein
MEHSKSFRPSTDAKPDQSSTKSLSRISSEASISSISSGRKSKPLRQNSTTERLSVAANGRESEIAKSKSAMRVFGASRKTSEMTTEVRQLTLDDRQEELRRRYIQENQLDPDAAEFVLFADEITWNKIIDGKLNVESAFTGSEDKGKLLGT